MSNSSQKRALKNYRRRLGERGMARFDVLGLDADRELIRALARKLAENGAEAVRLRDQFARAASDGEPPRRGGILAALRRSPLVGADLDVIREVTAGRPVDL